MSTAPVEIRPWRECPFIRGNRYIVRQSFPALRDTFTAGDAASNRTREREDLSPTARQIRRDRIVNASSKNAFASDQSLTDSALFRMKKDAAKLGANGILLSGVGTQQIGSIGQSFGNASAYSTGSATAYRYGNTVSAYGTGTTNVYGSGTTINTPLFQKVSSGMAIYVTRECRNAYHIDAANCSGFHEPRFHLHLFIHRDARASLRSS